MTRGVNDIDTIADAGDFPLGSGCSCGNRDSTFTLLLHPVHGSRAFVHFTDLVGTSGVVQNALRRRRLTGIDVRNNADVSVANKRCFARHSLYLLLEVSLVRQ